MRIPKNGTTGSGAVLPGSRRIYSRPISRTEIKLRQISSIILSILLVRSAGFPFTPLSWIIPFRGILIVDYTVSNFVLAATCYFYFCIASTTRDLRTPRWGIVPGTIFRPVHFWPWAVVHSLQLTASLCFGFEVMSRGLAINCILGTRGIGLAAVPPSHLQWAQGWAMKLWPYRRRASSLADSHQPTSSRSGGSGSLVADDVKAIKMGETAGPKNH